MDFGQDCTVLRETLKKAENEVIKSIDKLKALVAQPETSKSLNKSEDFWKTIHVEASKLGKQLTKEYPEYSFQTCIDLGKVENVLSFPQLWKSSAYESLVRLGYDIQDSIPENIKAQQKAYVLLAEFVRTFEEKYLDIFHWTKMNVEDGCEKEELLFLFVEFIVLQLLNQNRQLEALKFLKENIPQFKSSVHEKEIQKLLCGFLHPLARLLSSPRATGVESLKERFVEIYCRLFRLPKFDPLAISCRVGTRSIPVIDKVSGLLKNRNCNLSKDDELPIELELLDDEVFHSVFSCPVLKQQSTEENPTVLLPCGHAITKEAVNRLSKGNNLVRFKCPYCPVETNAAQCLRLYF